MASGETQVAADQGSATRLQKKVLTILFVGSLIPFGLLGASAWVALDKLTTDRALSHLETIVGDHAATVDLFLEERLAALRLAGSTHDPSSIREAGALDALRGHFDMCYPGSFVDLGVIDASGTQVRYSGPYDLAGRVYVTQDWYTELASRSSCISDVFLGYRREPHFIMAVKLGEGDAEWILRATVNSVVFEDLVKRGRLGRTGDSYLVSREGLYQTHPRGGIGLLEPCDPAVLASAGGATPTTTRESGGIIRTTATVNDGRWILVGEQAEEEFMAPVRRDLLRLVHVFGLGALVIVVTAFFSTRFLVGVVRRQIAMTEQSDRRFLGASRLASIGEMATGLAHEINNPLAIISSEQTNIDDLLSELPPDARVAEMRESVSRSRRQIHRCKAITQKMLQFGRQREGTPGWLDAARHLKEIVRLLAPQALVNNVEVCLEAEPELPEVRMDPGELQQVVANLLNNAVQAMPRGGAVVVSAVVEGGDVVIVVEDTGPGIPPLLRARVFEPFFTTKQVGQGTGLGLSVCYGIIGQGGGEIREIGGPESGAIFEIRLPTAPSRRCGSEGHDNRVEDPRAPDGRRDGVPRVHQARSGP